MKEGRKRGDVEVGVERTNGEGVTRERGGKGVSDTGEGRGWGVRMTRERGEGRGASVHWHQLWEQRPLASWVRGPPAPARGGQEEAPEGAFAGRQKGYLRADVKHY